MQQLSHKYCLAAAIFRFVCGESAAVFPESKMVKEGYSKGDQSSGIMEKTVSGKLPETDKIWAEHPC